MLNVTRRAVLVAIGAVTALAVATPAHADSAQSLAGPNMWIVKEFAQEAAVQGGNAALDSFTKSNLNGPTASMPTTAVSSAASTAARSKGFKLRGRGLGGAVLSLAAFAGLDLLLAGDGAPDPGTVLPAPEASPYAPGWDAAPTQYFTIGLTGSGSYYGQYQWNFEVVGTTATSATLTQTIVQSGLYGPFWQTFGQFVRCREPGAPMGTGVYYSSTGGSFSNGSGTSTSTAVCTQGRLLDSVGVTTSQDGVSTANWYPEGHPLRPAAEVDPDTVQRIVTADTTCRLLDGSTVVVASSSAMFTLAQVKAGATPPEVPYAACPTGGVPESIQPNIVTSLPNGGSVTTPLSDPLTAPSAITARAAGLLDGTDPGLELFRQTSPDGAPQNCNASDTLCRGWWEDPSKSEQYTCRDGGVLVALEACTIYRRAFDPVPSYTGAENEEASQCWPAGTGSFNPLEWVLMPVKCALSWAFVPTTTQVQASQLATEIQTKTPFPQLGSLVGLLAVPDTVNGACLELALPISFVIGHDQPLLDSCTWSDPVSQQLHEHRTLLGVVVWVSCAIPLVWWAWRQYAPGATGAA